MLYIFNNLIHILYTNLRILKGQNFCYINKYLCHKLIKSSKSIEMRLKFGIAIIVLLCISNVSYAQNHKNTIKSLKELDMKIEEGDYSSDDSIAADRLVIENSEQATLNKKQISYSEKEWIDLKREINSRKQRITENSKIYGSKTMDTIFITVPSFKEKSQISSW